MMLFFLKKKQTKVPMEKKKSVKSDIIFWNKIKQERLLWN